MTSKDSNSSPVSESAGKQTEINGNNTTAASTENDSNDNSEKKEQTNATASSTTNANAGSTEYNSNPNPGTSLPLSPVPNFYYTNGAQTYVDQTAIAAEAYQAAIAAGYDPSDPNAFAAYSQYGMHPQYSQYYPADYGAGYPGTPPLQGQTSPSLPPQPLSPYFTATSPPIAYYPTSPQVGSTGIIHSPPIHPYLYTPQSPYGVHALHTLSPTLSHTSSSAPNSPPPQYLPGPGVPSPKVGPLNSSRNSTNSSRPNYNYGRRNSASQQAPNGPNFSNPTKTTNIYIRGLPPTTTDDSLHTMCSMYGNITSSKAIIDQKQGDCKGYGFVMYETEEQAKHAIEQLTRLGLQVSFAKVGYESFSTRLKNLQDLGSTNIYLSNLPLDMKEQQLEELFSPYKVVSNRILRDQNGTSRGVGFARMEDRDSALEIIKKFNGYQLPGAGLPLQVRFADSLAQKKLKGQTAKKRTWRTRDFASLGGRIIPQVPVTPEHMLGMTAGSPPGAGAYLQYFPEGVQPTSAYPPGSISPTFGPQYAPRYFQPIYTGPVIQHGVEGQNIPPNVAHTNNQQQDTANIETSSNTSNSNVNNNNSDSADELSDLVQKKLAVDGVTEKESSTENGEAN